MSTLSGWLLIDKPIGVTSTQIVGNVRRVFGKKSKVGHAGTLDPFASGLLMVALNEATKTINFAMDREKEYQFTLTWGEDRDTLDIEGAVTNTSDFTPSEDKLAEVIKGFIGKQDQLPPRFSAKKVDGERAYDLARKGVEFELKTANVELLDARLLSHNKESRESVINIRTSKGFYVRSLARDIAHAFNACGFVSALRRTTIGKFSIDSANIIDGKTILDYNPLHLRDDKLLPLTSVLDDILVLEVSEYDAGKLKNGMKISMKDASFSNPLVALTCNDVLVALVSVDCGMAQPQRVFNL